MAQVVEVIIAIVALETHQHCVSAELDADLAAPDVVIEAPEELPPFIDRLVVVQPADQGDIVRKRVAQRGARVILIPGILEAAGVETKADVVIKRVITRSPYFGSGST